MTVHRNGSRPTVLLVHDAFASTASWGPVVEHTAGLGVDVVGVANPLRGLAADAQRVRNAASRVDGPVILVGHGYGGAVVSVAAADLANVRALVFVAGLALAEDESCVDLLSLGELTPVPEPTGTEILLRRTSYAAVYAHDLPAGSAAAHAACQNPITAAALEERAGVAGWRKLPSWYLVATADRFVDPASQRRMADRAGSSTVFVEASHCAPVSVPAAVAQVIATAIG